MFCAVGVRSSHRYEYEAAFLGAQPDSGGPENAGPQTSTGVCCLFLCEKRKNDSAILIYLILICGI